MCSVKKPKAQPVDQSKPLRILLPRDYLDDAANAASSVEVGRRDPGNGGRRLDTSGLQLGIQQII